MDGINVSIKNILKGLAIIAFVLFFCPNFLVSCSGRDINVSGMGIMTGIKAGGERLSSPHPIMIIAALIPIAIAILLFARKHWDGKYSLIISISAGVDIVVWLITYAKVKSYAEENMCNFSATAWYVINIIALVFILILDILIVLGKSDIDDNVMSAFSGVKNSINKMQVSDRSQISSKKASKSCPACGGRLKISENGMYFSCNTCRKKYKNK